MPNQDPQDAIHSHQTNEEPVERSTSMRVLPVQPPINLIHQPFQNPPEGFQNPSEGPHAIPCSFHQAITPVPQQASQFNQPTKLWKRADGRSKSSSTFHLS